MIREFCKFVINAIDGIRIAVLARGPAIGCAVRIEHSEVGVETAILLQHENHVIDGLKGRRGSRDFHQSLATAQGQRQAHDGKLSHSILCGKEFAAYLG